MAKGFYIGVDNVARKCKKAYIGIDGVAKKIKKMYIGVAGKARLFFSGGGEISYYGTTTTNLNDARNYMGSASVGYYALIAGGSTTRSMFNTVDVYDSSLTHSTASNLSVTRYSLSGTNVGDYALFFGGSNSLTNTNSGQTVIDAYSSSLTKASVTSLAAGTGRYSGTAVSIGDHALYAGGTNGGGMAYIDVYDSLLTRKNILYLSEAKYDLSSTSNGTYAFIGGGYGTPKVDVFDESLTKVSEPVEDLIYAHSESGDLCPAASAGDYAIFTVDHINRFAYDSSLTRIAIETNSKDSRYGAGVSLGGYAIIAGGTDASNNAYNAVQVYDDSLTCTDFELETARAKSAGVTVGDYALIAGGTNSTTTFYDSVEVFQLD